MGDRRRNLLILLAVALLLVGSVVVLVTKKTRLGLDLKGGVELVYQGRPTPQQPKVDSQALDRAIEIMRKRVDALGVAEPEIQRSGTDQVAVGLPGTKNAQRAIQSVGKVAQLYFYDWEASVLGRDGKPNPSDPNVTGGPSAGQAGGLSYYDAVALGAKRPPMNLDKATVSGQFFLVDDKQKKVLQGPAESANDLVSELPGGEAPRGDRVIKVNQGTLVVQAEPATDAQGKKAKKPPDRYFVLNDAPALSGKELTNIKQSFANGTGAGGSPNVTFSFSDKGRSAWQRVTRTIAQRGQQQEVPGQSAAPGQAPPSAQHFAAVLDGQLITVPFIDYKQNPDGIDGSNGADIEGGFTIQSAQDLARNLQTGALPIKLKLISQSQVSATLGKEALNQGLLAGAVGLALVALFLLVFYRVLGLIAVAALGIYALYFYSLIKLIPITLTLPGIAGLILTIGVAADANIVIFERVKEEIRGGNSVARGIAAGYKKGFAAILDANVVTIMTAFILFILATAGVKGFAFTLGIGTIVSLFTAVLATQAILTSMSRSRLITHPAALGAKPQRRRWTFDFMGASKWFFSMSGVILLVGALAIGGKGLHFGIDFESGTRISTAVRKSTDENGIRSVMAAAGAPDAKIQRRDDPKLGRNVFQISTRTLQPDQVQKVRQRLDERFGVGNNFSNSSIGPTFGKTIANTALIAIIASLLVITAYIALRFEWKYAVPVLIALMHDLLITAGVYSLTGREVTTSTVAALLTILGYSLYDTIIVFDRVRENVPRMPRAAFSQIVNRSMSEVLTRSLATTFSTLIPISALLFFGGETLKDFAFALLVGVASGAYSSIFIASPVLTHWKERERVYKQRGERIRREFGGIIPAYAVATVGGAPVDAEPEARRNRRRPGGLTTPEPEEVTPEEFEELVADLDAGDAEGGGGEAQAPTPVPARGGRPSQGSSTSSTTGGARPRPAKPKGASKSKSRNRRHGRKR
ncbi:MAG: protein translocase subunit SecD [Actinomycetota bacterium]|nr:protein translocase subunit SecD [Actinomycetota bacterium]